MKEVREGQDQALSRVIGLPGAGDEHGRRCGQESTTWTQQQGNSRQASSVYKQRGSVLL